jgi:hypothetical protein
MASEQEIALYYPSIDISDGSFINTAALYWDQIQTIVPDEVEIPYSSKVSLDAVKAKFLYPLKLSDCIRPIEIVGQEISKEIDAIDWNSFPNHREEKMYRHKFTPEAILSLESKLGRKFKQDGYEISLPEDIAKVYMSRLASAIAQRDRSMPITNTPIAHNILTSRFIDYTQDRKENQAQLVNLSLQSLTIKPEYPLNDVIKFREHHRDMLINYRRYIRELSRQIATGLDTTNKQFVFEEIFRDKILPAREEIKAKLSEGNIGFGLSAVDIICATVMGAIASGGTDLYTGIGGAIISLGVSFYQGLREDRNIINDHPLGYLYLAQKEYGVNQ